MTKRLLVGSATILVLIASQAMAMDKVRVAIAGGHEEVRAFAEQELVYMSLSELAEVLGGDLTWETVGHRVVYKDAGFKFEFLLDSPFFLLNDTAYNMIYPAVLRDGQLFVAAATMVPFLDRVNEQQLTWEPSARTIRAEAEYFDVTDISVQPKANGLLIEVYLTKTKAYDIFVTEGDWLNISIRDAMINSHRVLSRRDARYMYQLKVHQIENRTGQISMRLKRKVTKWTHELKSNPTRIQIAIADVDFELDTTSQPVLGPDDKIDVVVIDPGHGGEDYGAVGPGGTREKDVALDIAKKLARMIRKDKQVKVIMTRDRDKTVTLEERAKIANDAGTDLFVSIHANASPKKHHRGWNVFFLAPALNDSARSVEQLENSYFLRESYTGTVAEPDTDEQYLDPVVSILNEMIMTEFQSESYDFAQMVDREFRRRLDAPARGIDQAGFFVLNKVFTPSVLIESAFISNQQEERKLRGNDYQENVAKRLYEAIKRFKAKYESD